MGKRNTTTENYGESPELPTNPSHSEAMPDPKEVGKNEQGGPEFETENTAATVHISDEDAPKNEGGTYSEEEQLKNEAWAKLTGRKQLIVYNGPQTFTIHYDTNIRYTLTKGNNVCPIEVWEKVSQRSNVKRALRRGIMIDKGETHKNATVKGKYRDGNIIPDNDIAEEKK